MTTKPPSGLAASGSAEEADPDITKDHNEDGASLTVDPSQDVTVEATEDVTSEAAGHTPPPSLRPGAVAAATGQRAPTLLGVPIQSLPLPGVTGTAAGESIRTIDYDDEVTVLAQPTPAGAPLTAEADEDDAEEATADSAAADDDDDVDLGPSIVDDDEEETKVEAAETAMKAAESMDDVTTALSEQASLEREKALRRTVPAPQSSDDLEFADPDADELPAQAQAQVDDEEEESLDDELSDEDEVISAGGAIEEERELADEDEDDEEDTHDGVATATFMKPADTTGLSGLLSPRRPPTGGRDGFGSRLPTPYSGSSTVPAPSTSPFASRLGPAPTASPPLGTRATGNTPMTAIQVPPPSGAATTSSGPIFFNKQVPMPGVLLLCFGCLALGFGVRGAFTGKSPPPPPTTIVAKPTTPAAPIVEPVQAPPATAAVETKPGDVKPLVEPTSPVPAGLESANANADNSLWKPGKKVAPAKPRKTALEAEEDAALKPASTVKTAAVTPKPAVALTPKPTTTASASSPKPAKKPAKVWVDPFAQ